MTVDDGTNPLATSPQATAQPTPGPGEGESESYVGRDEAGARGYAGAGGGEGSAESANTLGEAAGDDDAPENQNPFAGDGDAADHVDIDWEDGQKYRVPKALRDGFLRQADYTRKTQDVASQRRQVEADRK